MSNFFRSILNILTLGTLKRMEEAEHRYQHRVKRNPIERTILGNREGR